MNAVDPNMNGVGKRRVNRHQCVCGHATVDHVKFEEAGKEKLRCGVAGCECRSFKPLNIGKKMRRAVVASLGMRFIDADYRNGENLVYLYLAGYEPPKEDFHTWMAMNIGLDESHPFAMKEGSAREAAKTVVHASDYLEGLQFRYPAELRSSRIRKEIDAGARLVFPDWTFRGRITTMTGVNLSRRAFGSATLENRRIALDITKRYFDRFPNIRKLQMRVSAQIEREGGVRPPHGYFTKLYGTDEDVVKSGAAIFGSQPIAHFLKLAIVDAQKRFERDGALRQLLPIHDELLCEAPEDGDAVEQCKLLQEIMQVETKEMPGLIVPAQPAYGANWAELNKV